MTLTVNLAAADGTVDTLTLPAPAVGMPTVTQVTDFSAFHMGMFIPTWKSPAGPVPGKADLISTPHGPGFDIHCADTDLTAWDSTMKTIALRGATDPTGVLRTFDFYLKVPTQTLAGPKYWNTGGMFESGHDTGGAHSGTSGHAVNLDNTGRGPGGAACFRLTRKAGANGSGAGYQILYVLPLTFDHWYHVNYQVKWSEGADGVLKVTIDGTTYMNFSGATWWSADGLPFWNFSWYSDVAGVGVSEVQYAGITITDG